MTLDGTEKLIEGGKENGKEDIGTLESASTTDGPGVAEK